MSAGSRSVETLPTAAERRQTPFLADRLLLCSDEKIVLFLKECEGGVKRGFSVQWLMWVVAARFLMTTLRRAFLKTPSPLE